MHEARKEQAIDVRSIMFVPGLSPNFIEKAHTRGADAIIIDMEDSIPPDLKGAARGAIAAAIEKIAVHLPVWARVNNTPRDLELDLAAVVHPKLTGVLLPKSETAAQVAQVAKTLEALRVKAEIPAPISLALLIETPAGMLATQQLAAADPSVVSLVFGSEDYGALLGVKPTAHSMTVPAQMVAMAARGYGLAAWGVAGSIVDYDDIEDLRKYAVEARQIGFTGSLAVNPKQIPIFNDAFGVSAAELAWATEVLEVFAQAVKSGKAAVSHKGKVVETPVALRAQRLVDRAKRYEKPQTAEQGAQGV